jgi:predicted AAA+ superfamily ATPase
MVPRETILANLRAALLRSPVVMLAGPRQSGKTTLAKHLLNPESVNYFDLEDPGSLTRLDEPMTALRPLAGLVVIDEVQRRPDLFPVLRVLADRRPSPACFLVLGSASGELLRQSSESLAGRIERITIGGFGLSELGADSEWTLWNRGGFPPSYLAANDADSATWRRNFIQTLLERDLPQWGVKVPATAMRRFWTMLAHYHGQVWNGAALARVLGVGESTTRRYLDLLSDAFMIRQLQPFHANLRKRQVKSPKIYLRDSGILHALLGIDGVRSLLHHPSAGSSWEGFVIEQVLDVEPHDGAYFWGTYQGTEMDLILERGGVLYGVECKRADAPRRTPSLRTATESLGLKRVAVIYPGEKRYRMDEATEAVPLRELADGEPLFP